MKKTNSINVILNRVQFVSWIVLLFLVGCTQVKETGPIEIKYNRDTCSECGMVISDPRFAAQIRGGADHKHSAFKFDDIGCAMKFARKQQWFKNQETESYVMDYETKEWIDSLSAHFKKVKSSPMGYGYSAHKRNAAESLDYQSVDKNIGE